MTVQTPSQRVETVLRAAWNDGERRFVSDLSFWDFDLEDEKLKAKLLRIAAVRDLKLSDLEAILIAENDAAMAQVQREAAFATACLERRDDLKVYYVFNTSDRRIVVLAKDGACARRFALGAGHIKDEKNGRVMVLKPEHEAQLRRSGEALGRALRDGKPGVVTTLGDNVVMEGAQTVFTPFTVVGANN